MENTLKATIDKILQLCAQRPEFNKELRRRLKMESSSSINKEDAKFSNIEKYLGLDYYVDTLSSTIDYSYIGDNPVKLQLESDNREMMRFRYGTRYHTISFKGFCHYAHLQAEMLLNYYYHTINNGDLESIKSHIKQYNPSAQGVDNASSLASIPYSVKLWAFNYETKIQCDHLDNIRKVRNELSHRSIAEEKLEISKYQDYLRNLGFLLKPKGWINQSWKNYEKDMEHIYDSEIKHSEKYKIYLYRIWYISTPYESIVFSLNTLSQKISSLLKKQR